MSKETQYYCDICGNEKDRSDLDTPGLNSSVQDIVDHTTSRMGELGADSIKHICVGCLRCAYTAASDDLVKIHRKNH